MSKTRKDLIYALLLQIGGDDGGVFANSVLKQIAEKTTNLDEVIPDDEFEAVYKEMKCELPAFTAWFLAQSSDVCTNV